MSGCEIWFYHLERTRLEQVLPELLEKTLARGWRAIVRTDAPERIEQLDAWLWTYRDDSFLAHGLENEPMADRAPVVLATSQGNPNGAKALFLLDGAAAGDLAEFERCILIFDGLDPAALGEARRQWAAFKDEGREVAYWRQGEKKGWERQA
ncbi:MAG TPA: DNA polymerase III subunit chi [Caulobacteraceae bacterium]|jgi:DNA polymerase-3 subunit chi